MSMMVQAAKVAKKFWWVFALRGAFALIFGIIALLQPVTAGLFLIVLIGFYFIVDGLTSLMQAFAAKDSGVHWGWWVFQGLVGIVAGILVLTVPPVFTALVLLYLVAFWAIIIGLTLIGTAFSARKVGGGGIFVGVIGALALIYGLVLLFGSNERGLESLIWVIGVWAIITGVMMIAMAFALRTGATKVLATEPTVVDSPKVL